MGNVKQGKKQMRKIKKLARFYESLVEFRKFVKSLRQLPAKHHPGYFLMNAIFIASKRYQVPRRVTDIKPKSRIVLEICLLKECIISSMWLSMSCYR